MNTKSTFLSGIGSAVKALLARRASRDFVCGDCTRNAQCGAEPSDQCVVRAAQITSERGRPAKREISSGKISGGW